MSGEITSSQSDDEIILELSTSLNKKNKSNSSTERKRKWKPKEEQLPKKKKRNKNIICSYCNWKGHTEQFCPLKDTINPCTHCGQISNQSNNYTVPIINNQVYPNIYPQAMFYGIYPIQYHPNDLYIPALAPPYQIIPMYHSPPSSPISSGNEDKNFCFRCGKEGHYANQCTQVANNVCYRCGNEGHIAKECNICFNCKKSGHFAKDCPEKSNSKKQRRTRGRKRGNIHK